MLRNVIATFSLTLLALTPVQAQSPTDPTPLVDAEPHVGEMPVDTEYQDTPSPFTTKRRALGYGRLTSNDFIGDGQDRWRTGSVTMSRAWGYSWDGTAPLQFGELLETRVQGQILTPDNLKQVNLNDRPFAGVLSIGVHTHMYNRGLEYAVGVDLVVIGPQTRLDQLQREVHNLFGSDKASDAVLALQIGNQIRPTFVAEIGQTFSLSPSLDIRPFVEVRAGDETLARVGADITIGTVTKGELLSRESITGQRYRLIYQSAPGYSLVVGGDIAYVSDSVYLPENRGYQLTSHRDRLRAGVHWQGENASVFYGLTYLGQEFSGQSEGQITGSIRVKLRF